MSSRGRTRRHTSRDWIRTHADLIYELPDGRFEAADVDDVTETQIQALRRKQVLDRVADRHVGKERECSYRVGVFEVDSDAEQLAAEVVEGRDAICPCGHAGIQNCGDHYECLFDGCDETYARDQLKVSNA